MRGNILRYLCIIKPLAMKRLLTALMLAFPLFTYAANDNKEKSNTKEAATDVITSFQGTIDDVTNYKPVGDVTLTLTSADNKLQKVIKTDEQGKFIVEHIPAGAYKVKFEKDGYESGKYQNLVIAEGRSNNFGFVLFRD